MKGYLQKIVAHNKKLMVKLDHQTWQQLHDAAKQKHANKMKANLPTFQMDGNDRDGYEPSYWVMLTLNKYEQCKMEKYEKMVRKNVNFVAELAPYDFTNKTGEHIVGCNLLIKSIRAIPEATEPLRQITADGEHVTTIGPNHCDIKEEHE